MYFLSSFIYISVLTIAVSILVCFVLEVAGASEGLEKPGVRPHIALIVLASSLIIAFFSFSIDSAVAHNLYFVDDVLARFAAGLLSISATIAAGISVLQMRHIEQERGETYGLILFALLISIVFCITNNALFLVISLASWMLSFSAMAVVRGSHAIAAEIAVKFTVASIFLFLIMSLGLVLTQSASGSDFVLLGQLAGAGDLQLKAGLGLFMMCLLFLIGCSPFFGFHIDYLDGAPSFAASMFATGSLIGGGVLFIRFFDTLAASKLLTEDLWQTLVVFAGLSFLVPAILANDQRKINRTASYLLLSQAGVILAQALADPRINRGVNAGLAFALINIAISAPGLIAALNYWKHPSHSRKTWEEYAGAGRKHPLGAMSFILLLGSIAGTPGTFGFAVKMALIQSAWTNSQNFLAFLVALSIVFATVPVVRLSIFLFAKPLRHELERYHKPKQGLLLYLCALFVLLAAFFPGALLKLVQHLYPGIG